MKRGRGRSDHGHWTLLPFADIGFEIPDEFVVGYALDYFRDLNVSHLTVT